MPQRKRRCLARDGESHLERPQKRNKSEASVPQQEQSSLFRQNGSQFGGRISLGHGSSMRQGNILNVYQTANRCLSDLRSTDPRYDKKRIEETKGGLLRDSYLWILTHDDFRRWRDDPDSRLLWIKGDPGKGKTMLLCGIIDELMNQNAHTEQTANTTHLLSFFFCQATDDRLNNATGVLRGLIYLLADQQQPLVSYIQKKYDGAGKALFEGPNAWFALRDIVIQMLQDPDLPDTTLIIDALDECETDLPLLLHLITEAPPRSRIKWLLSSRNRIDIEQRLRPDHSRARLSLELKSNADHVSHAVDAYIDHCISEIPAVQDNIQLQTQVRDQMRRGADVTLPDPDPLTAARYSCIHWVDHLAECKPDKQAQYEDLRDGGIIDRFLRRHYLHWLEALSILGGVSEGILAISKLNGLFQPAVEDNWGACLLTLEGHRGRISSVAFSPDSSRVASGSDDYTVKVWDAATGACLSTLEGHRGRVSSVALSPDSSRVASGSYDSTVKVWDAATGACLSTLKGNRGSVSSVTFSPDSSRVASGSWDCTVKVWDAATGACLSTLEGHRDRVSSVALLPDSSRVASGSNDGTVKVWDAATGACLSTLEGHRGKVSSVTFSPDSSRVASGSYDYTVKVWDAATGACLSTLEGHRGRVNSVAFSPDGNYLITNTGTIPLLALSKIGPLPTAPQYSSTDYYNLGFRQRMS
ncbi:hypothetical protein DL762_009689 [Monosporascus cannonballus]|uniref:Mitochondrial division protein 1 n=1 Tax=Monosporascus cannonballus TaxID=155416 RepID=A0ABY0GTI7_9PEZI|nr:hypothetical protein DL762_009689 [Monosporascus cannonballus]